MSFAQLLKHLCTIEQETQTQDEFTGEQIRSWETLYENIACRLRNRDASERIHGDKEYQKATHALYMNSRAFDISKIRIIIDGNIYNAAGCIDMGGEGKYLCVYLERYSL